jgi:hypothetical protein
MGTRRTGDSEGETPKVKTRQGRVRDPSKLSTKPYDIRKRLRNVESMREQDLELLVANDPKWKPVEEWDLEELARGRPRNKNGNWTGRAPKWITPMVLAEAQRRFKQEVYKGLTSYAGDALKVIYNLMMNEDVDDRLRIDAAKFVVEHAIGKPKVALDIVETAAAHDFMADLLVLEDGSPAHPVTHPIIDGEAEEVDDDE